MVSRSDRDDILQSAIDTAVYFLEKRGEFFPFAVVKTVEDETVHIQSMIDGDRPYSENVINSIANGLKSQGVKENYRSIGIVSDVKLTDTIEGGSSDAIRVQLDDHEAGPANCYVPYAIEKGAIELGQLVATRAVDMTFFTGDS